MTNDKRTEAVVRRLLRGSLSNYLGKFIALAAWFFLTPFMLQQLGATVYGLWVLASSVAAYGWLFDFGIAAALTKYIAEYRATGQADQAKILIVTGLYLYSALGLMVIALSATLAPIFPDLFSIAPDQHAMATQLVLLSGLEVGLAIPCATTQAILRGLHRFELANLLSSISTIVSVTAMAAILVLGGGVIGLMLVGIAVMLIMQVPSIWCIHRIAPELRVGWRGASWQGAQTLASFSSWLFVLRIGGYLEMKTDEIVIGAFLPIDAVARYNIARKLSTLPQMLTEQLVRVLLPLASELHAERDMARLRSLYIVSMRLTLVIILAVSCPLMLLPQAILTAWVGASYADAAHLVLILTLASLIDTSQWPAGLVLQGMAQHRVPSVLSIYTGVANIVLSIVLVHFLGLTGIALGTLIPTSIVCLGFVLPYTMRIIGISRRAVVVESFLPAVWPAIPMVLVTYMLREALEPTSLFSIVALVGLSLLVYVIGYLSMGASELERQTYRSFALSTLRSAELHLKRW